MITNFFSKSKPSTSSSSNVPVQPPPAKKPKTDNKKRNELTGYNPILVKEAVQRMKKSKESGGWRKFSEVKMRYTIITKDWCYDNNQKSREWQLCPFGMVDTMTQRLKSKRLFATSQTLSPKLKESLGITDENYDKTKIRS